VVADSFVFQNPPHRLSANRYAPLLHLCQNRDGRWILKTLTASLNKGATSFGFNPANPQPI